MRIVPLYLVAVLTVARAASPLTPEASLENFALADSALRVELVVAEPLVESPCAIAFDERGRLFVAENRGYPQTNEPPQGRIAMLEDSDGDGRMDKRSTFADALTFPNGIMPWQGGVIVTCAPDVLFLKDTTGDGVADERKVLLTGFDTKGSTQLRVNCPTLGPDGWIYFAAGLAGGDVTAPGSGKPPVKMTGDLRWQPSTGEIESVDGRSQFGMSFDDFGRRFICMNRLPVQHVVLQSKWLRRNPSLAFSDTVQDCNERTVKTGLKGGGDGVRLFPISHNITTADSHGGSFSAACGITIWRGGALPDSYRGCALTCDPTGNLVHADKLTPRGPTFTATAMFEGKEFLASRDDWFRPVFLATGPDGALYIADMYRKVIEHPDYLPEGIRKRTDFESGKAMGRIWRIIAKSAPKYSADRGVALAKNAKPLDNASSEFEVFRRAIVLGDLPDADSLSGLAEIAAKFEDDRWMRAVILSGIHKRELPFLKALAAHGVDHPGIQSLMGDVARLFGTGNIKNAEGSHLLAMGEIVDAALPSLSDGRPPVPALLARFILFSSYSEGVGAFLSAFVSDEDCAELTAAATRIASDSKLPITSRKVALSLLSRMSFAIAGNALASFARGCDVPELHQNALLALANYPDAPAAAVVLEVCSAGNSIAGQRDLILDALLRKSVHVATVLEAIENSRLPASAIPTTRRTDLLKHRDAVIRARAEKVFAATTPEDRQKAFDNAKAALALKADAKHGRELFKTQCATCHRLDREGSAVGPDLLDMRNQPKETILFHIIVPDAEVAPAFAAYLAETNAGRTLAGILASETSTSVTLRGPLAEETALLRSEIKRLEALPNSLMPAGFELAMSMQDLADLLAYLKGEAAD